MTILIGMVVATLLLYAWIAKKAEKTKPDISRFFMYGHKMPTVEFISTVSGSSISLGAAILAFLSLGYYLPWIALVATASWVVGYYFHYQVLKKAKQKYPDLEEKTFTLHGYLGHSYNSEALPLLASIASIIGYAGAYGVEMVAITKLTAPFFNNPVYELALLISFALFIGWYATRGGFVSVVKTDKFQLLIFFVGIIVSLSYVVYQTNDSHTNFEIIAGALKIHEHSFPFAILLGLLVINLPWQIIDMSQWQRSLSCPSNKVIHRGLIYSSIGITISWLLLISLGLWMHTMGLEGEPISAFLTSFSTNPIWYAFFLVAAFAALFSTADSYVIAASQTYICDIKYPEILNQEPNSNNSLESTVGKQAKSSIWKIAVISPIVAYGANMLVPGLLELFFMVFSAQLSLVPSVINSIRKEPGNRSAAVTSVISGLTVSIILFIVNLMYSVENLIFYSPVATLIVSFLVFYTVSIIDSKEEKNRNI